MTLSASRRLFVFRHGQTDWNLDGRIQGHLDIPLNDCGRAQARALIRPLGHLQIEAFLSSDLSRARETAEIVAQAQGLQVYTDAGLREIHLGAAQGLTREEIEEKFGRDFFKRMGNKPLSDADVVELGSETGEAVLKRSLGAMERFLTLQPFERVAVVTHGGVLRRLLQLAISGNPFPPPIPNGVVFPFEFDFQLRKLVFGTMTELPGSYLAASR